MLVITKQLNRSVWLICHDMCALFVSPADAMEKRRRSSDTDSNLVDSRNENK